MIIQCESCSRKFVVKDIDIPHEGRTVQCGYCSVTWHQMPISASIKSSAKIDESPSSDEIKASDGKTYKFLGNQWAELLPSGKTGLVARKKISQELNKITGKKEKKISKKRQKKFTSIDPSQSINTESEKQPTDVHESKQRLGFLGYVFLLMITGLSIIGVLKTFENYLLNAFPDTKFIFELLNQQIKYFYETAKNMIAIIKDLMNSY